MDWLWKWSIRPNSVFWILLLLCWLFGKTTFGQASCDLPLGMEDGKIEDDQITASSERKSQKDHGPTRARLNHRRDGTNTVGAWQAAGETHVGPQWIQVEFHIETIVTAIITQGRADDSRWVTQYNVNYTQDGSSWYCVYDVNNTCKIFNGNSDQNTHVTQQLPRPLPVTVIRIHPVKWHSHISMRFELLGCVALCNCPLGMEDGDIKDDQITASSQYNLNHAPSMARLNDGGHGWAAETSDDNQWIQVAFHMETVITAIITQGREDWDQMVTRYQVKYTQDGSSWYCVKDGISCKVFYGNSNQNTNVTQQLPLAVTVKAIRIHPMEWNDAISMRFELLGCVASCNYPLGMEDGQIMDDQIKASSVWQYLTHGPTRARLNQKEDVIGNLRLRGAWSALTKDQDQWIQVDFYIQTVVTAVITQGRERHEQWVTQYKLYYKEDGSSEWKCVYDENTMTNCKIFDGNSDPTSTVTQHLPQPLSVIAIQIHPVRWHNHISMRFELLGCVGPRGVDNEAPILNNIPTDVIASCLVGQHFSFVNWTQPIVTDNSGCVSVTSNFESRSKFYIGATNVTYTAVDSSGNAASGSFFVTIIDEEDPELYNFPSNMSVNCFSGENFAIANWTKPNASDNSGIVTLTSNFEPGSLFYIGATNVTYTAVDPSSNVVHHSFVVLVVDDEDPVMYNIPSNMSVNFLSGKNFTIVNWTKPNASDNSGIVTLTSNFEPGSLLYIEATNVTYTAVDPSGNVARETFVVMVVDEEYPVLYNFPSNVSVNSFSGENFAIVNWTKPNAVDNSGIVNLTSNFEPGSRFYIGATNVTYTAVDKSGNVARETFVVMVVDKEYPVLYNFPGNLSVNSFSGENFAIVNWTKPYAIDNSGIVNLTSNFEPGSRFYIGATNVTYMAFDPSGNAASDIFVVMVIDEEDPVFINMPSNIFQTTVSGKSFAKLNWTQPNVTDNSGIIKLTSNFESGSQFYIGATDVTYTAVDSSGNEARDSFVVMVVDKEYPVLYNFPSNLSVNSFSGENFAIVNWTKPYAIDNSGIVNLTSNFEPGSRFYIGATNVTYTAFDPSGNAASDIFVVMVIDEEDPVFINVPGNIFETSVSGKSFTKLNWTQPNVTDNSGIIKLTSNFESGSQFYIGATDVTYTAVDSSGNEARDSFVVIVKDEENPVFIKMPSNIFETSLSGKSFARVNWTQPNAIDNSGIVTLKSNFEPGSRFYIGATNVTYTAIDPSGNVANDTLVVIVRDAESPLLVNIPRNILKSSDSGKDTAIVNWKIPTATDNSGVVMLKSTFEPGSRFYIGATKVTYTAVDSSGNEANDTFVVTIIDKKAMEFIEASNNSKTIGDMRKFIRDWDDLPLKLLGRASKTSEAVFLDMQSFVLKQFKFSSNADSQEFVVTDDNVTTTVCMSPPEGKSDHSMTVGILKVAHESMSLNDSVKANDTDRTTFEFGSKIISSSLFGKVGNYSRVLPLRNGTYVYMTMKLLAMNDQRYAARQNATVIPGCFFFNHEGYWSQEGCIVVEKNMSHVTCSCDHLTSFAVLMQLVDIEIPEQHTKVLSLLTMIGLSVSSFCLLLTLLIFAFLRLHKKHRVIIHANLAFSLLVGQLLFLFGTDATPKGTCKAMTVLLHYFYMAVFMWMLMEGVFLFFKLKPGIQFSMKPAVFMAVAWGTPLPITMTTFAIRYKYYGLKEICWLPTEKGIIFAFAGPAILIISVNVLTLYTTLRTFQQLKANQDKSEKERMRASLRALVILAPLLGLTWIFGLLRFNTETAVFFSYLFVIFNGSQITNLLNTPRTSNGVMIFICQCLMDEDVSKYLKHKLSRKVGVISNNDADTRMVDLDTSK